MRFTGIKELKQKTMASSVSRVVMSFCAAGLKTMLNFFCATTGFQFCDEGFCRQTAGERVFGIGILDPASEKGIVFNKIVGEILLRDMVKDRRGFAVSCDNDIFHFAGIDDAHGFLLEFFDAGEAHVRSPLRGYTLV